MKVDELRLVADLMAKSKAMDVFSDSRAFRIIDDPAPRGTWSYYQCWQALSGLRRGAVIQDKLAASTVAMLGYWHERGNTGAIAGA